MVKMGYLLHEEKEKGTSKRFLSSHLNGAQKRAGKAKPLF